MLKNVAIISRNYSLDSLIFVMSASSTYAEQILQPEKAYLIENCVQLTLMLRTRVYDIMEKLIDSKKFLSQTKNSKTIVICHCVCLSKTTHLLRTSKLLKICRKFTQLLKYVPINIHHKKV